MKKREKKTSGAISSHMETRVSSFKEGQSRDMAKGPRKYAKDEVTNEVSRPPKR